MMGRVYFIADGVGRVKVGYSTDPKARLRALQTAHGGKLEMLGSYPGGLAEERRLHSLFAASRLAGEWFDLEATKHQIWQLLSSPPLPLEPPSRASKADEVAALSARLVAFLRSAHPRKTAQNVASMTGVQEAAVGKWLEGRSFPSGEAFMALIGAYGLRLLAACWIDADQIPDWLSEGVAIERASEIISEIDGLFAELETVSPKFARGRPLSEERSR